VSRITSIRGGRSAPQEESSLGWRARWTGLSVVVHVVAFAILLALAKEVPRTARVSFLPLPLGEPQTRILPFLVPAPASHPAPARRASPTSGLGAEVLPEPEPVTRPSVREAVKQLARSAPRDSNRVTVAAAPGRSTRRLLRPSYGDGRLWVPPIDILELGRRLPSAGEGGGGGGGGSGPEGPRTVAQLDSTVTARLRAFLDTMPRDSFAPAPAPQWTTQINGKTWGIDGKWIYLGGLKLPAALLALLPIPQGNIDQSRAALALMRMRDDIMQAAERAETAAEFRRYVNELRKRKDQERNDKRKPVADSLIP
jgi:hypothetical protein